MRNKATGYSFGYGFVEYADEEGAAAAIGQINGMKILNKTLKVPGSNQSSFISKY